MKLLAALILLSACAAKPKLYPNAKYKSVGKETAESDVEVCMKEAETFLESEKGKDMVKGAGKGAIFGAAIGAVGGMLTGNFGSGLARGGAIGATAGGTSAALSPDQVKRSYVNQCLADKGYQVIGWK